jgi:uncharacterized protein (DUF2336 family)
LQLQPDPQAQAPNLTLSPEDVDRLLNDKTSETRVAMTNKIAATYNRAPLSPQETMVAEQIFRLLMKDTELRVRVTLAQHLKDSPQVPRDVVKAMAHDVDEVSLPILEFSEVLTDSDLMELVQSTEQVNRYLAISRRRFVSDAISDTLLKKGDEEVANALVNNEGATISEENYTKIIEQYRGNDTIMQSLSKRPYLPVVTVEKMINMVSSSLADTLKKKYKLSTDQIDKEVEKAREKETLHLIRMSEAEPEIDTLIAQLIAANRLTPSLILSALCQGNFNFFEMSLAKLSDIPASNARKLINDRGELGFRAIYNKSGLPDAMFPAVKLLLKVVRELHDEGEKIGSPRFANRIVERILQYSEDSNMENLSYIIALVRRIAQ